MKAVKVGRCYVCKTDGLDLCNDVRQTFADNRLDLCLYLLRGKFLTERRITIMAHESIYTSQGRVVVTFRDAQVFTFQVFGSGTS